MASAPSHTYLPRSLPHTHSTPYNINLRAGNPLVVWICGRRNRTALPGLPGLYTTSLLDVKQRKRYSLCSLSATAGVVATCHLLLIQMGL